MASQITSRGLLQDPDYYRNRYRGALVRVGLDPALVDQDANLQAIYNLHNSFDNDYLSNINDFFVTGRSSSMPEDYPDRLKQALAGGSIDAALAKRQGGGASPIDRSDLWGTATPPGQRLGSGGVTTVGDVASIGADLAAQSLPLTRAQQAAPLAAPHTQPGFAEAAGAVDIPNVSDGGPGTSTAKGADNIARQAAKRAGGGNFMQGVDRFLTNPAQSVGGASQQAMRDASAALYRRGMPGLAGMAKNLAPVARWAAPAAAVGGTFVLPAVTGAISGNETAGTGGAVLQGGSALAGAAIGQALIPIPVVGAVVGSMAGNAIGGGLAAGAANAVEKAQMGDGGFIGSIGRALDPFVDTAFEKEQKAVMQQMNSPAMQEIRQQERTRMEQARAQQAQDLLMQAYMRVV